MEVDCNQDRARALSSFYPAKFVEMLGCNKNGAPLKAFSEMVYNLQKQIVAEKKKNFL